MGDLREFERHLLAARRSDRATDAWLRQPTGQNQSWVRDRSTELIPIHQFGAHLNLPDRTGVLWQDRPDFVLTHLGGDERVEVTTTAPQWIDGVNHGHQRAIEGELHNKGISRVGHIFSRDDGIHADVAMGKITVVHSAQRDEACRLGLVTALAKKSQPSFDTSDCTLLIYCDGFGFQTIDGEFPEIVRRAALSVARPPFARIIAIHERVEGGDGYQDITWAQWMQSN